MWKDIIGYENIYQINEYGDIYNLHTKSIMAPYISNKGYKIISLAKNGKKDKFLVHRLVAIHFISNPENFPIVLHNDNVKTNTYYANLHWGTYSENNSQAIRDGLNNVPKPDNRKFYQIYNNDKSIICHGAKEAIITIGYGNDSIIRNLLFRNDTISQGPYKGCLIRKTELIKPIKFIDTRSTIIP